MAFDAGLAVLVLGVAAWTIVARDTFAEVVRFIDDGLLLALVCVRLAAPDVALTETALGSGLTGVLLVGASTRVRRINSPAVGEEPAATLRLAAIGLCILVSAGLAALVLLLPEPAPTLAVPAGAKLAATRLRDPAPGGLVAYRSAG